METNNEIYNLLMSGASLTRNWMQEREAFGAFAKPRWKQWGGDELVDYMMHKYVLNDEQSIVEYLYNLDERNKQLVIDYLKWR